MDILGICAAFAAAVIASTMSFIFYYPIPLLVDTFYPNRSGCMDDRVRRKLKMMTIAFVILFFLMVIIVGTASAWSYIDESAPWRLFAHLGLVAGATSVFSMVSLIFVQGVMFAIEAVYDNKTKGYELKAVVFVLLCLLLAITILSIEAVVLHDFDFNVGWK